MASLTTLIRLSGKRHPTPGPGEYVIPSIIGSEGRRSSLAGAREPYQKIEGAHYEAIPSCIGEGPKYTLHLRPKDKDITPTPGPDYMPPRFGRGGHTSAFHGYVKEPKSNEGPAVPGPLTYVDPESIGARKGRGWTVKARQWGPDERIPAGPGPGRYLPNYAPTQRATQPFQYHAPAQHKDRSEATPGPGQYVIDRALVNTAMAFHGYTKQPTSKDSVPGPGNYKIGSTVGRGVPSFSIRPRCEPSTKGMPNAPYQAIPTSIGEAPKWSFGGRSKNKPPDVTPGPNYMPPTFGKGARASSLYSRRDETQRRHPVTGPGPGEYPIDGTIGKGKKFTMKARQFPPGETGKHEGPGPGAYVPNFLDAPVPRAIHPLVPDLSDAKTKAPYLDIGSTIGKGPKITIGIKESLELGPGLA